MWLTPFILFDIPSFLDEIPNNLDEAPFGSIYIINLNVLYIYEYTFKEDNFLFKYANNGYCFERHKHPQIQNLLLSPKLRI